MQMFTLQPTLGTGLMKILSRIALYRSLKPAEHDLSLSMDSLVFRQFSLGSSKALAPPRGLSKARRALAV
eukprot:6214661-Pleurochrysis_carterae.AAC.2